MKQDSKLYKLKNPAIKFYCALCRSPREMLHRKNLTTKNYFQIVVLSVTLIWALFSLMGFKSLFLFFIIWSGFEFVNKLLYRKELPCPHCGFDPTWYKKDIKLTRKRVKEFFDNQQLNAASANNGTQGSKNYQAATSYKEEKFPETSI